jgi:hypothetical protein
MEAGEMIPTEIIVALIVATPPTIIGLAQLWVSMRNADRLIKVDTTVTAVKKQTDGLLEKAEIKAEAAGATRGHAEAAANTAANLTGNNLD